MKKKLLPIIALTLIALSSCSGLEKEILGTWETDDNNCGTYIDQDKKIEFDDDNMVIGIEGFKEYKIDDEQDPAILTLTGGYEDNTNYEIKIEDDSFFIVEQDEADEGFDSTLTCEYEKVSN